MPAHPIINDSVHRGVPPGAAALAARGAAAARRQLPALSEGAAGTGPRGQGVDQGSRAVADGWGWGEKG